MTNRKQRENELLLCCGTTEVSPKIKALVAENLDWEYILKTARRHRVMALLYWHLQSICPAAVPQQVLTSLQKALRKNIHHSLHLTKELLNLLPLFEAAAIPVLTLKNPILTQLTYNKLALRQFSDLDILVQPEQVHEVNQILRDNGYQPRFYFTPAQETLFLKYDHERAFYHPEKSIKIDIHWSIISHKFSFSPHSKTLLQNPYHVTIGNQKVPTISPENRLLFLCAHGAKHNWNQLNWIADIAQLLKQQSFSWDKVKTKAGTFGTQTMLLLGLYLPYKLFNAPLPPDLLKEIEEYPKLTLLGKQVEEKMFTEFTDPSFTSNNIYLGTMESRSDKFTFWFDVIMTPTAREFELLPLPKWLEILYYPIRLLRLAVKYSFASWRDSEYMI